MARVARLEVGGGWYHVINRGHQRRASFGDRRCYDDFLKTLIPISPEVWHKDPRRRADAKPLPFAGGAGSAAGIVGAVAKRLNV